MSTHSVPDAVWGAKGGTEKTRAAPAPEKHTGRERGGDAGGSEHTGTPPPPTGGLRGPTGRGHGSCHP